MDSELLTQVRERLLKLRKDKGLKQQGVADALKMSRSRLGAHEKPDHRMVPDVNDLQIYADYYKVSTMYFFENDGEEGSAEMAELYSKLSPSNQQVVLNMIRALTVPDPVVMAEFISRRNSNGGPE